MLKLCGRLSISSGSTAVSARRATSTGRVVHSCASSDGLPSKLSFRLLQAFLQTESGLIVSTLNFSNPAEQACFETVGGGAGYGVSAASPLQICSNRQRES